PMPAVYTDPAPAPTRTPGPDTVAPSGYGLTLVRQCQTGQVPGPSRHVPSPTRNTTVSQQCGEMRDLLVCVASKPLEHERIDTARHDALLKVLDAGPVGERGIQPGPA